MSGRPGRAGNAKGVRRARVEDDAAARGELEQFLEKHVYAYANEQLYLESIGVERLMRLRSDPAVHYVPRNQV